MRAGRGQRASADGHDEDVVVFAREPLDHTLGHDRRVLPEQVVLAGEVDARTESHR